MVFFICITKVAIDTCAAATPMTAIGLVACTQAHATKVCKSYLNREKIVNYKFPVLICALGCTLYLYMCNSDFYLFAIFFFFLLWVCTMLIIMFV